MLSPIVSGNKFETGAKAHSAARHSTAVKRPCQTARIRKRQSSTAPINPAQAQTSANDNGVDAGCTGPNKPKGNAASKPYQPKVLPINNTCCSASPDAIFASP